MEDEYEASKRRLQEFKKKIGITGVEDDGDSRIASITDCTVFTPVRESLMGLAGYIVNKLSCVCTPGSC